MQGPFLVGLLGDAAQAGADLAIGAGRVGGVGLGLFLLRGGEHVHGRGRLQAQVGTDVPAALESGDLMAAEAAALAHEVVAPEELGGLLLAAVADEVGDLVMAFQTGGLDKPAGQHGEVPEVVALPGVLLRPLVFLPGIGRGVRGQVEAGGTALAAMADRAADFLHGMRAVGVDEKVEPGMGGVHLDLAVVQVDGGDVRWDIADGKAEVFAVFLTLLEQRVGRGQLFPEVLGGLVERVQSVRVEDAAFDAEVARGAAIGARRLP